MTQNLNPHLTWDSSFLKINITFKCSKIYKEPTIVTSLKKKEPFIYWGWGGGGVLESIPLPYYISFTPHLKLVTFGRISFRRSQFSHFQFMYLPYKAFKKVILKWIDSFDGEFSHFKNTTYQNLLPHKILEMQPPLQSIQSWKYIRSHPAAHLHEPINRKYFSSGSYYRWTQENFFTSVFVISENHRY